MILTSFLCLEYQLLLLCKQNLMRTCIKDKSEDMKGMSKDV